MPRRTVERGWVKVATFNINNIKKRLDNLLGWLAKAEPGVASLPGHSPPLAANRKKRPGFWAVVFIGAADEVCFY
jgi:hypothetical protein